MEEMEKGRKIVVAVKNEADIASLRKIDLDMEKVIWITAYGRYWLFSASRRKRRSGHHVGVDPYGRTPPSRQVEDMAQDFHVIWTSMLSDKRLPMRMCESIAVQWPRIRMYGTQTYITIDCLDLTDFQIELGVTAGHGRNLLESARVL